MLPVPRYAGLDVAALLDWQAKARGEHAFLVWAPFDEPSQSWTYAAFAARTASLAGALAAKGVRPGDRVMVAMENCPEFLVAWFACARLGAILVAGNPALAPAELDWAASHCGAALRVSREDCASLEGPAPAPRKPDPDVDVAILYTSGTTARPKGVLWTHGNALWAAQLGAMQLGLRAEDRLQVCLPLCHVVGFSWSILPALWAGATVVLQPRFSASRYWDAALAHRCTVASHVQFTAGVLSRQPAPAGHAFRLWGNSVWSRALESRLGVRIAGWWGMTELIAAGIVGDPQATVDAFTPDGWFRTGDRVVRHEDGSIAFSERAKDVIKVGGENVSPAEVERAMLEMPGVREAAVVGRSDPAFGEVVVAFVAGAGDNLAPRVAAHCAQVLAKFKVPREVVVVDALPRGNLGKIAKNELRGRAARNSA